MSNVMIKTEIKSDGSHTERPEKVQVDKRKSQLKKAALKVKQDSWPYEREENEIDILISSQLAHYQANSNDPVNIDPSPVSMAENRNKRVYSSQMAQNLKFKHSKFKKSKSSKIKHDNKKKIVRRVKKEKILQFPYLGPKRGALAVELILNMNIRRLSFINDGISLRKTKSQILYKTHSFASPSNDDSDSETANRIATERRAALKPRSEPIIKEGMVPIMYKYIEEVERRQEESEDCELESSIYDSYRKVNDWMTASIESEEKLDHSTEQTSSTTTQEHDLDSKAGDKSSPSKLYDEFLCCCPSSCDCQKPRCDGFPFCPCHAQPWPTSSSSDLSENWKTVLNKFTKDCYFKGSKCDESFQKKPIIPITYLVQYLETCEKCPCGKKRCTHKEELRERYNAMVMKTYYSHLEPSASMDRDSRSFSTHSRVSGKNRKKSQDGISLDKNSALDSSSDSSFSRLDAISSARNNSVLFASNVAKIAPDSLSKPKEEPASNTNLAARDSVLTFRSGGSVRPCRTGSRTNSFISKSTRQSITSITNKPRSSLMTRIHDSATTVTPKETPVTQSVFSQEISTEPEAKKSLPKTPVLVKEESEPKESSSETDCSDIIKMQNMHYKELLEKCCNLRIELENQKINISKIMIQRRDILVQMKAIRRFKIKLEKGLGKLASIVVGLSKTPFKGSTFFDLLNYSFGCFLHDYLNRKNELTGSDFQAITAMLAVASSATKTPTGRRFLVTNLSGRAFLVTLIKNLPYFSDPRLDQARRLMIVMLFNLCTEPMGLLALQHQSDVLREMQDCIVSGDVRKKMIGLKFFELITRRIYNRNIYEKIERFVPLEEIKSLTYNIKQTDVQKLSEKVLKNLYKAKKAVHSMERQLLLKSKQTLRSYNVPFEYCGAVQCSRLLQGKYAIPPRYKEYVDEEDSTFLSNDFISEASNIISSEYSDLITNISEYVTDFAPSLYTDEEDKYGEAVDQYSSEESLVLKPPKKYSLSYQTSVVSIFSSVSGNQDQESVFLEVDDDIMEIKEKTAKRKENEDDAGEKKIKDNMFEKFDQTHSRGTSAFPKAQITK